MKYIKSFFNWLFRREIVINGDIVTDGKAQPIVISKGMHVTVNGNIINNQQSQQP